VDAQLNDTEPGRVPPPVRIRSGTATDAIELTAFARLTFVETYAGLNSPADTDQHLDEFYHEDRQRQELVDPCMHTLLAYAQTELVGFAQLEQVPVPECVDAERAVGLKRYYVKSSWHGKGIAGPLLSAVVDAARSMGASHLWLTVWNKNPRAIAYYRKVGFRWMGSNTFMVGADPQDDSIMSLELGSYVARQRPSTP
jgi:GNAT superfamily N-acetyltransferase